MLSLKIKIDNNSKKCSFIKTTKNFRNIFSETFVEILNVGHKIITLYELVNKN